MIKKFTYLLMSVAILGGQTAYSQFDLKITEVYEGVSGDDVTGDWIEITNFGMSAFTFGVDGELYFDDSSGDPTVDERVTGLSAIGAGESVIVVLENDAAAVGVFEAAWGVSGFVGYLDGDNAPGLSQGGEAIFLFDSNTLPTNIVDTVTYDGVDTPGAVPGSTWTYDPVAGAFTGSLQSVDGVNGAFTALLAGGNAGDIPLVGSPGVLPVPEPAAATLLLPILAGCLMLFRRRS